MRRLVWDPMLRWAFYCDECGNEIRSLGDIVLVRRPNAFVGDDAYVVHKDCVEAFGEHHDGRWEHVDADTLDSAWLLYV